MMIVDEIRAPAIDPFDAAAKDGRGCLAHLLGAATREGHTVRELVEGAPVAHLSWRALRTMGVAVEAASGSPLAAVAEAHPFLGSVYAETLWCGSWGEALRSLPETLRGPRMLFGRFYAATILLPRRLLLQVAA